jgi:Cu(I)/Ag(I) efflux system membrane fusion protein
VSEEQEITSSSTALSPAQVRYRGEGNIEAIVFAHATVTLAHGPIPSLKWPAMTMDFRVQEAALLQSFKPGQKVVFEIAEEPAGEFVIVRIQPADSFHDH